MRKFQFIFKALLLFATAAFVASLTNSAKHVNSTHGADFASRQLQLRGPATQRRTPHDVATTTAMLSSDWVPVMVNARGSAAYVGLCELNQRLRHNEPSTVPMFREWTSRSGCSGGNVQRVPLGIYEEAAGAIKQRYDSQGGPDPGYPPYTLNGIIFHMMRTGSTLWGNSAFLRRHANTSHPSSRTSLRSAIPSS
jgi:hypothetical protein